MKEDYFSSRIWILEVICSKFWAKDYIKAQNFFESYSLDKSTLYRFQGKNFEEFNPMVSKFFLRNFFYNHKIIRSKILNFNNQIQLRLKKNWKACSNWSKKQQNILKLFLRLQSFLKNEKKIILNIDKFNDKFSQQQVFILFVEF